MEKPLADLTKSISKFGLAEPLVCQPDGLLIGGHARYQVLLAQGVKEADCYVPDRALSQKDMIELNVRLNKNVAGEFDFDALANLPEIDVADLVEFGFDEAELGVDSTPDTDAEPQIDRAAELNKKWQVKAGNLWRIGEHRLLCGDSTKREDVERVMGGVVDLCVTSPPYGVGKEYEEKGVEPLLRLLRGFVAAAKGMFPCAAVNIADPKCVLDKREAHTYADLIAILDAAGLPLISTRIWTKQPAWSQGPYWLTSYRPVDDFEYIGLFGSVEHKERVRDDWRFRGVWEFASVAKNDVHSAAFPQELPSRLIRLLTDEGATIYEPFTGSGTTMVACENLKRKCRGVEISPDYCAVILERMATAFPKLKIERV
jgi:hypothetical protein